MPTHPQTLLHSLSAYPTWLVVVCAVVVGAFALWLAAKLLEWSLAVIAIVLLVTGGAAVVWLVFR